MKKIKIISVAFIATISSFSLISEASTTKFEKIPGENVSLIYATNFNSYLCRGDRGDFIAFKKATDLTKCAWGILQHFSPSILVNYFELTIYNPFNRSETIAVDGSSETSPADRLRLISGRPAREESNTWHYSSTSRSLFSSSGTLTVNIMGSLNTRYALVFTQGLSQHLQQDFMALTYPEIKAGFIKPTRLLFTIKKLLPNS